MKTVRKYILGLFVFLIFLVLFTSCGGSKSTKLPENAHDKVTFAFNGVEKSFKKKNIVKSKSTSNLKRAVISTSTLNQIKGVYVDGDEVENGVDGLEYDEPPMIQFQCLKSVYEKIGDDFTFDTKYYDNVTGQIYLDLETGENKADSKDASYLVDYDFKLSIQIGIDDNDLITAHVTFEIDLTKGNDSYSTKWYARLELNYDMEKSSPNYDLAMYTANDEKEMSYLDRYTYEYDYVEVVDNAIKEWRKFDIESKTKLIKDSNHTSFDAYIAEDIEYEIGTSRFFYDGVQRKVKQMNNSKKETLGKAYFDGIGLNNTDINDDPFYNKEGSQNSVLKTIYSDFSNLFGFDFIYALFSGGDHGISDITPESIEIYDEDGNGIDGYSVNNTVLDALVAEFTSTNGEHKLVKLCYKDKNGGLSDKLNRTLLSYYFTAKKNNSEETYNEISVTLNDTIFEAYERLIASNNITSSDVTEVFYLIARDNDYNVSGQFRFIFADFDNGGQGQQEDNVFPQDFSKVGVPEYKTTSGEYKYDSSSKILGIHNSNKDEASNYITILHYSGFTDDETSSNSISCKKQYGDGKYLYVRFDYSQTNIYTLFYEIKDESTSSGIHSVAIVGINGWDIEDNSIYFEQDNNTFTKTIDVKSGDQFKIVANGTWDMSYGYTDIKDLSSSFTSGENNKVVVNTSLRITLIADAVGETLTIVLNEYKTIYQIIEGTTVDSTKVIVMSNYNTLNFNQYYEAGIDFTITIGNPKNTNIRLTVIKNGTTIHESTSTSFENTVGPFTLDSDITINLEVVE